MSKSMKSKEKSKKENFYEDGPIYTEPTEVAIPTGNGAGTARGMGAATKGGKFSGVF